MKLSKEKKKDVTYYHMKIQLGLNVIFHPFNVVDMFLPS